MPIFAARLVRLAVARLRSWRLPLAIVVFVFLTSWPAMWLAEPESNPITDPGNFWWYFVVTSATVGYGDFFPTTAAGHVVGAYVIVGGIATVTLLFTQLATYIQNLRGRRMRGRVQLDLHGHIVLLGYTPGRTDRIVTDLSTEGRHHLVLCAWDDVGQNPMPDRENVDFVRGDLTNVDVMTRACVGQARTVVIDGRDDNETLAIAVAVDHANPNVHMVAALREMGRCEHLRYVNPKVQCVQWHVPNLLSEEANDRGITQVYAELMTSGGGGDTYSFRLPDELAGTTFGALQTEFGRTFGATLIAARRGNDLVVSPPWDTELAADTVLYYLARERIDARRLTLATPTTR